jgi:hypothetical protein
MMYFLSTAVEEVGGSWERWHGIWSEKQAKGLSSNLVNGRLKHHLTKVQSGSHSLVCVTRGAPGDWTGLCLCLLFLQRRRLAYPCDGLRGHQPIKNDEDHERLHSPALFLSYIHQPGHTSNTSCAFECILDCTWQPLPSCSACESERCLFVLSVVFLLHVPERRTSNFCNGQPTMGYTASSQGFAVSTCKISLETLAALHYSFKIMVCGLLPLP